MEASRSSRSTALCELARAGPPGSHPSIHRKRSTVTASRGRKSWEWLPLPIPPTSVDSTRRHGCRLGSSPYEQRAFRAAEVHLRVRPPFPCPWGSDQASQCLATPEPTMHAAQTDTGGDPCLGRVSLLWHLFRPRCSLGLTSHLLLPLAPVAEGRCVPPSSGLPTCSAPGSVLTVAGERGLPLPVGEQECALSPPGCSAVALQSLPLVKSRLHHVAPHQRLGKRGRNAPVRVAPRTCSISLCAVAVRGASSPREPPKRWLCVGCPLGCREREGHWQ